MLCGRAIGDSGEWTSLFFVIMTGDDVFKFIYT